MHFTNKISRIFGKFASKKFPKPVQDFINGAYVKILGLDMSEFKSPSSYETLNALFTRALVNPRSIDESLDNFISPTDSFITQAGSLRKDTLMQIKGMDYNIHDLLTWHISDENKEKVIGGEYMNFYLSPKDYHRYHSPYYFSVTKLVHVPGVLYPVNFSSLRKQKDLFAQNERVILECKTSEGKLFYMVFIGALNVGEMVFSFEPRVETNKEAKEIKVYEYEDLHINKGDCLGWFKMGSTVVMAWEKNMIKLDSLTNQKVKFGNIIGSLL
jgi:phosphatidylserine decarboxylase